MVPWPIDDAIVCLTLSCFSFVSARANTKHLFDVTLQVKIVTNIQCFGVIAASIAVGGEIKRFFLFFAQLGVKHFRSIQRALGRMTTPDLQATDKIYIMNQFRTGNKKPSKRKSLYCSLC